MLTPVRPRSTHAPVTGGTLNAEYWDVDEEDAVAQSAPPTYRSPSSGRYVLWNQIPIDSSTPPALAVASGGASGASESFSAPGSSAPPSLKSPRSTQRYQHSSPPSSAAALSARAAPLTPIIPKPPPPRSADFSQSAATYRPMSRPTSNGAFANRAPTTFFPTPPSSAPFRPPPRLAPTNLANPRTRQALGKQKAEREAENEFQRQRRNWLQWNEQRGALDMPPRNGEHFDESARWMKNWKHETDRHHNGAMRIQMWFRVWTAVRKTNLRRLARVKALQHQLNSEEGREEEFLEYMAQHEERERALADLPPSSDEAALRIQSWWRGQSTRQWFKGFKASKEEIDRQTEREYCATRIQSATRGFLVRNSKWKRDHPEAVGERKARRLSGAALRIQAWARGCRTRKWLAQRQRSACVIQRAWRSHLSRVQMKVEHDRKEEVDQQSDLDFAAKTIQRHWRGYRSRGAMQEDQDIVFVKRREYEGRWMLEREELWHWEWINSQIQSIQREDLDKALELRVNQYMENRGYGTPGLHRSPSPPRARPPPSPTEAEKELAAILIQRNWRGHWARAHVPLDREEEHGEVLRKEQAYVDTCARLVQAFFRKILLRRAADAFSYEENRQQEVRTHEAVHNHAAQRAERRATGRKPTPEEATLTLQAFARMVIGKKRARRVGEEVATTMDNEERDSAAYIIQQHWRRIRAEGLLRALPADNHQGLPSESGSETTNTHSGSNTWF